ncbi:Uncharacterized protein PHSC3_001722 [Chlamydiales bacterium STE3]|nr:Uncharacterized protein PHSC3_001722 [Chlamydiales bacterium STE3]
MGQLELFLGFQIEKDFADKLQKVNLDVRSLFIKNQPGYLQEVEFQQQRYIGKMIDVNTDLDALFLLKNNILSILKKLVPEFPYKEDSLVLFPLAINDP